MAELVVVATFRAREGREQETTEALRGRIEQTHGERGCLRYALHRDPQDPATMVIVEAWTSRAALEEHGGMPDMADVGTRAAELAPEPPPIRGLEPLVAGDPGKGAL